MPSKNEHSVCLKSPEIEKLRVRRTRGSGKCSIQGVDVPSTISVNWYIQKTDEKETAIAQALRFPIKAWSESEARTWLKENKIKYLSFEIAEPKNKDAADRLPCYRSYVDKTKKQLDIVLHDEIGFWGMQSKEFHELLNDNKTVKTIAIDINSPGGSVFDGFSIYNALKAHPAQVQVKISGVAASIASVIAMAGNTIEMPENAMMMIHKPVIPFTSGNSDQLRKDADALDKIEDGIIAAYRPRLDKTVNAIHKLLNDVTWYSAAEAHEAGLADLITEEAEVENYFDFENYAYGKIPANVLNRFDVMHGAENLDIDLNTGAEENGKFNLNDLVNKLKQYFQPIKKESNAMPLTEQEYTNKITGLENSIADLTKSAVDTKKANEDLTKENERLAANVETQQAANRSQEYGTFVDGLVGEGKVKPADKDTHIETMELKYQQDAKDFSDGKTETPKLDGYKKMLSELGKIVDISGNHIAKKGDAQDPPTGDDKLDAAATKIVNEAKKNGKGIPYTEALKQAFEENPALGKTE